MQHCRVVNRDPRTGPVERQRTAKVPVRYPGGTVQSARVGISRSIGGAGAAVLVEAIGSHQPGSRRCADDKGDEVVTGVHVSKTVAAADIVVVALPVGQTSHERGVSQGTGGAKDIG